MHSIYEEKIHFTQLYIYTVYNILLYYGKN